ncbi:MAG TPA: hypothetical protein IAA98_16040 [Candidatus Avipropionibacterium avicola]|uniref:Uncharacterized protein n=1 Tax=Candidatus Avipropionibacterium avicola TaxID=2840701 RepID=A0A9D1H285_9ACTN|nr:hypothetical protein [Candidatus Avipropionibacterium avicola]
MALKSAELVSTAPVVATGLLGGYLTARETGIRPLGGVVLALAGALAARTWARRDGAGTAVGLSALYVGAFGLSHLLAKKIGAWPAVLAVTGVVAGTAWAVSDRDA